MSIADCYAWMNRTAMLRLYGFCMDCLRPDIADVLLFEVETGQNNLFSSSLLGSLALRCEDAICRNQHFIVIGHDFTKDNKDILFTFDKSDFNFESEE